MLSKFRKFIDKESLFKEDDKILLACSGGIDSMVLADMLLVDKWNFGIAHINHQTRGNDSDKDQMFVENYCKEHKIECHSISVPMEHQSKAAKENFHAFARSFRYDYLNRILLKHEYNFIATAHHSSDTLETFFLNLTRSTGLDGLTGIPLKNGLVIRPLLFATKEEIIRYALKFKIDYREDSSNESTKYRRNQIRHELIPKLKGISEGAEQNTKSTIQKLATTNQLLIELINSNKFIEQKDRKHLIQKKPLEKFTQKTTLLFYLIKTFGFNFSQAAQIIKSINKVGAMFHAPTHQLLVDREHFIIEALTTAETVNLQISKPGIYQLSENKKIKIELTNELQSLDNCEYLDADKVSFPITIRNWVDGDKFAPLGMEGKMKKVKDYLIDKKVNRLDKKSILVLASNNKIAWLIGERISDLFKYTEETKEYMKITLLTQIK